MSDPWKMTYFLKPKKSYSFTSVILFTPYVAIVKYMWRYENETRDVDIPLFKCINRIVGVKTCIVYLYPARSTVNSAFCEQINKFCFITSQ